MTAEPRLRRLARRHSPFLRFIAPERRSPHGFGRILLGFALVAVGVTALSGALAEGFLAMWGGFSLSAAEERQLHAQSTILTLFTLAALWPLTAAATALLHRRGVVSLLGLRSGAFWRGVLLGAAATLAATPLLLGLGRLVTDGGYAFSAAPAVPGGFGLSLAALILIPLQASGEELLFRGYLLQNLAARVRHPLVWAVAPSVLFGWLHYDPSLGRDLAIAFFASTLLFALGACYFTWRTGSLGFAIGAHVMNNWIALLILGLAQDHVTVLAVWRVEAPVPAALVLYTAVEMAMFALLIEVPPLRRWLGLPAWRTERARRGQSISQ